MEEVNQQPGDEYWEFIEPIWEAVSTYDGVDVFLPQFQKLTPAQGHIFAAHWCQSEVCNGGLHQFFSNSTGVLAPEAVAGFRAIGLEACTLILEEAISFLGEKYPREQETRAEVLAQLEGTTREEWDPFFELDGKFYDALGFRNDRFLKAADDYARRAKDTEAVTKPPNKFPK
jgi:hypothetical protein